MNIFTKTILLILIAHTGVAQSLKKEVVKSSFPSIKEVFYVLKSDRNVRHGDFEKTSRGDLICKGQYEHGKKSGVWEYYDIEENLTHKADYTNFNLIYPNKNAPYGPEVLGGYSQLYKMISYTMMYPADARRMGTQGIVKVKFTVGKNGKPKNFTVTAGIGHGCDEEAIRAIKECKMDWFPAKNEQGELIEAEVELPVTFKLG